MRKGISAIGYEIRKVVGKNPNKVEKHRKVQQKFVKDDKIAKISDSFNEEKVPERFQPVHELNNLLKAFKTSQYNPTNRPHIINRPSKISSRFIRLAQNHHLAINQETDIRNRDSCL